MYIIGNLHVLSLNFWAEQRQNFQLQRDVFVMFCLVFCVFTCVAPTLFKILGTALRGQSCPLDMLDSWPSLLVFKVAVSHSSSAVRVCFTKANFPNGTKKLTIMAFCLKQALQCKCELQFSELQRIKWRS